MSFYVPEGYRPQIDLKETQVAIKTVKDFFQKFGADVSESQNGFKISFKTAEKKQKYYYIGVNFIYE